MSDLTGSVRIERSGGVTTVILDRPQVRNAVDQATAQALADAFRAFDADDDARVAVLWGAGGTFCSGADLHAIAAAAPNRFEPTGDAPMGPTRMRLGKPVIAAVSGYAVAGGLELALWCDLRVVEQDAVFGVFCRRWGVPLVDGGTVRLPQVVGLGRALDMILTGRPVDAEEALAIGLATRIVPSGTGRQAAEELARAIAEFPQTCLRHDRASVYDTTGLDMASALVVEHEHGRAALAAEAVAGASRFSAGSGRGGASVSGPNLF
jgi:enoyl-CoA hydratase